MFSTPLCRSVWQLYIPLLYRSGLAIVHTIALQVWTGNCTYHCSTGLDWQLYIPLLYRSGLAIVHTIALQVWTGNCTYHCSTGLDWQLHVPLLYRSGLGILDITLLYLHVFVHASVHMVISSVCDLDISVQEATMLNHFPHPRRR